MNTVSENIFKSKVAFTLYYKLRFYINILREREEVRDLDVIA